MFFDWLKKYMPRGIYGRGALILLVPVVVIQLVVMITFSQRYFEDITRQLSSGVVAEIGLYVVAVGEIPPEDLPGALEILDDQLGFVSTLGAGAQVQDRRPWYDISARVIGDELHKAVPGVEGIDVGSDPRRVVTSILTGNGRLVIDFPRRRASASNPHQLMVWTAFTGLVMTLIAFVFLRNQLRPIRQLARAAEAFGRGESRPYRPAGAIEVRSAGAAFLNMRARLERQIEQRTLMLSGVSHDLRTPLTRIRLGLSMLDVPKADADELKAMQRDLDEMERLIDAFLDFARADATEEPSRVTLQALIDGAVDRSERAGRPVAIGEMPDQPVTLMGRPDALARALDNLLSNARRYGTQTRVSLRLFERAAVISVEDDGPGIGPEDRERALQPFVRLDAARNQNRGSGVGLGLAIARDVARRHGGTLRLEASTELGGLKADLVLAR
ncbi:ATP-binding protein [Celeribacter neptunius]|uniref:histidine kinase n=1 Tax=Celeribacter neptunius TaxID=588602 RepID=A0A1I3KKS0_9RHOB|nr:ATP-binding protein [Celeribacter neptunius]SFI73101.1 two-component system, OmpR family, osmolarity sensor histidine kinase EnvZ [Celeribacter neptunius]